MDRLSTAKPLPHTAIAVSPLPVHVEGCLPMTNRGSFPSLRAGREGAPSGAEGWGSAENIIHISINNIFYSH